MWYKYEYMHSNIIVYQKDLHVIASIKVGCTKRSMNVSSGPKAEGVPIDNQKRRGLGGLDNARHIDLVLDFYLLMV